jgi:signal transduction histidine kinase
MKKVPPLPKNILRSADGYWTEADEFSSLVMTSKKLIDRINLNYKLTHAWTMQMAHELKTPLAIMRVEIERQTKAAQWTEGASRELIQEISQMSAIISQFLDWAELESAQEPKDLHALRLQAVVREVVARLDKISPGRLRLRISPEMGSDFSVFAKPIHVDQILTNLITNALKFSPETAPVEILIEKNCLKVKDLGAGIPAEVLERQGQPFNIGVNVAADIFGKSGNGLGLAWVSTVAKLYRWDFELRTSPQGTEAVLCFPLEEEEVFKV